MKRRLLAVLLTLTMVLSLMTPAMALEGDPVTLTSDGAAVDVVTVCKYTTGEDRPVTVTAETDDADASFRWQFLMEDLDMWVNIYGEESSDCVLTYAKVCNMLDENEEARMRCVVTLSDGTVYGQDGELDFTVKVDEETLPEMPEPEALKPQVLSGFEVLFPDIEIPEIEIPEIEIPEIEIPEIDIPQWPDLPELPDMPGFPEFPDYPTDFPVFPLEPSEPAEETPVTPSEETPVTPSEEPPVVPSEETPVVPSEETPVTPSEEAPVTPSEETPVTPSEETPVTPSEETSAVPSEEATVASSEDTVPEDSESGVMTASAIHYGNNTDHTVIINYVFSDNTETVASAPYTASLGDGTSFKTTVTNPVVLGYVATVDESLLPEGVTFDADAGVTFNIESITKNITVTVTYQPTYVNYTVRHYLQNVDDDKYAEPIEELKTGKTNSIVPEVAHVYTNEAGNIVTDAGYEGFYALLYEQPAIAADGSTVVEVYYDRYYYLMNFDLDGGYGVEPIYARYDTSIVYPGNPTKAGYTFMGWTLNGEDIEEIPATMPAENRTYKAVWQSNDTAKVTVVFWGENADDKEYSYEHSATVQAAPGTDFTYSPDGTLVCPLEEHTHDASCGYACNQTEHTHGPDCYTLTCTQEVHTHTEACYTCGKESHTHNTSCYAGVGSAFSASLTEHRVSGTETNGSIGQSQYYLFGWQDTGTKYIYINGTWYRYTGDTAIGGTAPTTCGKTEGVHNHTDACLGCGKTAHTHTDYTGSCYTLTCTTPVHTHSADCEYTCGKAEHTHDSECYMADAGMPSNLWTFEKSDTVTVAADGSSVVNVYYNRVEYSVQFYSRDYGNQEYENLKITAKWGASIHDKWPTYNGSSSWYVSANGNTWQNSIQVMPVGGAKFYGPKTGNGSYTAYYYVEVLPGEAGTTHNGVTYKLHHQDTSVNNGNVTNEERYQIQGFTYKEGTANGESYNNAEFYYTRNRYDLVLNNGDTNQYVFTSDADNPDYSSRTDKGVLYEAPLNDYIQYHPTAPSRYEPGSVVFGGWYLNPECTGEEYKLDEHNMPAKSILLYAKWEPVSHYVKFYLDKEAYANNKMLSTHPEKSVTHGAMIDVADPTNGSYTFVGWFYMDGDTERAFDFANMPVNKDLQVYGKWSSNVLKPYTIYYKIKDTDTEIADPTTGSGLAGATKTFEAKGGDDLYPAYQDGFFPVVQSHSMTIDINATEENDTNSYTFWYVKKEAVPYIVRYVDEAGNELVTVPQKVVADNHKAVVTETFVPVSGMLPDAYQKRLVVTGSDELVQGQDWINVTVDGKDVQVHPDNVITFVYTEDTTHAYYKISHYTEDLNGSWTEYGNGTSAPGTIGDSITGNPLTISGFTYDHAETVVNGEVTSSNDYADLTADGLEIKLYYKRNSYPYVVYHYLEGTTTQVAPDGGGSGLYNKAISESPKTDLANYEPVSTDAKTLYISTDAGKNVITFYYKEREATIRYEVVGPDGAANFGSVSPTSETLRVLTGTAQGSTATASSNTYRFVGWYKDEACTTPVDASWVDANNKITPVKADGSVWTATTYYAKFEYNLTDLTITKDVTDGYDANDSFIFEVKDSDNNLVTTVTLRAGESVTITGLTVGETYTVTENDNWSWRYTAKGGAEKSKELSAVKADNKILFENTLAKTKWLSGSSYIVNNWDAKKAVKDSKKKETN